MPDLLCNPISNEELRSKVVGKTIADIDDSVYWDKDGFGHRVLTYIFTDGSRQSLAPEIDESVIVPLSDEFVSSMRKEGE